MTGVVLLPGAGMSDWLWTKTVRDLKVPSLVISPRMKANTKERRLSVGFDEIIDYHKSSIESKGWDKVIIVGHSGAGILAGTLGKAVRNVSEVIFVAANIPKNGTTAIDVFPDDVRQRTTAALRQQAEFDAIPVRSMESFFIPAFANNCGADDVEFIKAQSYIPEPLCVITAKVNWDDYPHIRKTYVICQKDKTLTENQQEYLAGNLEVENLIRIDTDHLPMISAPEAFMRVIEDAVARS